MRAVRSALAFALALALAVCARAHHDITDEQYYSMPRLFHLDEYAACVARRGLYCLGTFELEAPAHHQLYRLMQMYSSNWVDHFNHTRLHRGLCVTSRCARPPSPAPPPHQHAAWFASCVNASTMSAYNLSARLMKLEYCHSGAAAGAAQQPLTGSERAFAALVAALLALCALATALDLTLSTRAKQGYEWAVSWSAAGCWRALVSPPPRAAAADLRALDGLRVLCMLCVIIEHVCWITTQTYLADTRRLEQTRRAADAMLLANSTLVVQIFFLMSSFLLAHKLLAERRRGAALPTFCRTLFNRILRVSPSYYVVVWFAASWWERAGGGAGPLWPPLVAAEAAVCRRKWWTHLLYLNNLLDKGNKCLIQTWYLAADMQLYAASLALMLALQRAGAGARAAIAALAGLLAAAVALLAVLAYRWRLVPTFIMHNPESVRSAYSDSVSFDVLYQSPLGNAPGALAGLLLAHVHHALRDRALSLADYKVWRWSSVAAVPLAVWWAAASPRLVEAAGGGRAPAAALAALERPVFAALVALALLGAMHGVPSAVGRVLSWAGWSAWARLSFGALLLHMPLNKALVAARLAPSQLDRYSAIVEWFGVASVSYAAALPLALLVELPVQRLHRALQRLPGAEPPPPHKTDL